MRRGATSLAACGAALMLATGSPGAAAVATPSAKVILAVPEVIGPVPVTATSHPFLDAKAAMEAAGYVEEEFFLRGRANVYDWAGATRDLKVVAGPGRYVTRILVRRPRDPARFSGNVEVNILNASNAIDAGAPMDARRMVQQGDVWIGITTKALTAAALKRFDPQRYAPIDWSNPAPPAMRCAKPHTISTLLFGDDAAALANSSDASPETEDGLVWDMIGQLGLLLKSEQRQKILPGFGKPWVYMDGTSQSGEYMRTWMVGFHDRYRTPDGKPVYDGYLEIVGPLQIHINQCAADVAFADPRQKVIPAPDAPYMVLYSEAETWFGRYTRQPDMLTPKGGIVTYQVAGGPHGRGEIPGVAPEQIGRPSAADVAKASLPRPTGVMPAGLVRNDYPWAPVARGAYHNLQLWVRQGVMPPPGTLVELDSAGEVKRDQFGNAVGGVRLPYVEVPVAAYRGALSGGGFGSVMGSKTAFTPDQLKALYPDHAAYVAKFTASTDRALAGRWISPEDAAAMKKAAEDAAVPPQ